MTPRSSTRRNPADCPAATIAAEVHAALDALKRAVAAGKAVHGDVKLELVIDDLAVISSDLALVNRDLLEMGR